MTTNEEFLKLVHAFWEDTIIPTMFSKGNIYSDEDRFHNFRVISSMRCQEMEFVAGGMVIKQITLLYDLLDKLEYEENFVIPLDLFDEVLKDIIIYCFLIRGMLEERTKEPNVT